LAERGGGFFGVFVGVGDFVRTSFIDGPNLPSIEISACTLVKAPGLQLAANLGWISHRVNQKSYKEYSQLSYLTLEGVENGEHVGNSLMVSSLDKTVTSEWLER